MKRIVLMIGFCMALSANSQTIEDAIRFNRLQPTGTARSLGMAGAYTAVGADFTSATLNPAGLGLYRGSDISFSTYMNVTNSQTTYLNQVGNDGRTLPGIGSFGLVFHNNKSSGSLTSWTFAIGYNQLGNYLRRSSSSGINNNSSITDYFAEQSSGEPTEDLTAAADYVFDATDYAGLAYNTGFTSQTGQDIYMTYPGAGYDANTGTYVYQGVFDIAQMEQTVDYKERGRHNEWTIAWGGNFNDRVHFGAKLGINDLGWRQTRAVIERDVNNVNYYDPNNLGIIPVDELSFTQDVRTSGAGVNASIGLIVQPHDYFRFGIAVHSPSLLSLRDRFTTTTYIRDDFGKEDAKTSAENIYNYRMVLPYRLNAGVMVQVAKLGILSGDIEFTDYRMTDIRSSDGADADQAASSAYFSDLNRSINNYFDFGMNARLGAEVRLAEVFYVRAGYAIYGSVLNEDGRRYMQNNGTANSISATRHFITGGVGYKGPKGFYFNMSGMYGVNQDVFSSYNAKGSDNPVFVDENLLNITATIGFYIKSD